jgi:hypothetical protein
MSNLQIGIQNYPPRSLSALEDYAQAKIRSAYLRFNGQLQSTQDLYEARLAKWQGNQAFTSGLIGGATSLLSGASSIGQIRISKGWGTGSSNIGLGGSSGPGTPIAPYAGP